MISPTALKNREEEFQILTDPACRHLIVDYYEDNKQDGLIFCCQMGLFLVPVPGVNYRIGMFAVTQEQYRKVMGKNPSYFSKRGKGKEVVEGIDTSEFPVEMVSWNDAVKFCKTLSEVVGLKFRLPTEAEWEYCCRAGTTTLFNWGDSINSHQANFNGNYPHNTDVKGPYLGRTCRVGSYAPNGWGLYDMHGNVWEWCSNGEGEEGPNPTSGGAAGTALAYTASPRAASGSPPGTATTASDSGSSAVEGEDSPNPTSREVVGTTPAPSASPRTASGSPPGTATTTSDSGSSAVEGEDSSDPTNGDGADAGVPPASTANRLSDSNLASCSPPGTVAITSASGSSAVEGEDSSDPMSGGAAGTTTASTAGRRTASDSDTPPDTTTTTSASGSFVNERRINGGSWCSSGWCCRLAHYSYKETSDLRYNTIGFRVLVEGV